MEKLLKPDFGLMFWTFVNFAILVAVLAKLVWKPLLKAIAKREHLIAQNIEISETSKTQAQIAQQEVERKLKELGDREKEILQKAQNSALAEQEKILNTAKAKAQEFLSRAREDLSREKDKLSSELKKEVAAISVSVAQKIIGREVDQKTNEGIVNKVLEDLNKK